MKKAMDIMTIVFPAIVSIFGVLNLTEAGGIVNDIATIALGAMASIASVIYNKVSAPPKIEGTQTVQEVNK